VAQTTQLIYTDNPGALSAEYILPATLDLTIQSIVARINGAGAGSSFYPTLSVYSSDDKLMYRVRSDTLFAAGDTGVVTWSPFLRTGITQTTQGAINGGGLWQTVANPATIPDGFVNPVALIYDTVVFDSGGYYAAANSSRLTAPTDGIYGMRAQMGYSVTVAGSFSIEIVVNGTFGAAPHWKAESQWSETGNYHAVGNITAFAPLHAGDYIECYALQKTGAARAYDPTASWFELIRLGDAPAGTQYGL
jgi:hypothetical protein